MYTTVAVTLDFFCIRPFALHRQQPEKDKQNVDFAPPWKNFCGRPCFTLLMQDCCDSVILLSTRGIANLVRVLG